MNLFSGPVTVGTVSEPACMVGFDLAANGYVEEEFFAPGTARGYDAVGEARSDGHWVCRLADDAAPYRTRVLVRRPADANRISGVLLATRRSSGPATRTPPCRRRPWESSAVLPG